jgi:glutamine synthetase
VVVRAVNKWGKLLRVGIAHSGNDHRLGANEAPPAIISVYLGDKLQEVVESIMKGKKSAGKTGGTLDIGVQALPTLPRDASDRNRTSPFAFTGNKFEFRAVGSSQNISKPNALLNLITAESLDAVATELEKKLAKKKSLHDAVNEVVQETLEANQKVIWNGDNYTKEWHAEAEKRGLPNNKNTIDALAVLGDKDVSELFKKYKVLTPEEVTARQHIGYEQYVKTINIEALQTAAIAKQQILPAALRYQKEIADAVVASKSASKGSSTAAAEEVLSELGELTAKLSNAIAALEKAHAKVDEHGGDPGSHAKSYRDKVIPAMNDVRAAADALEGVVADDLWPLPKYRELLFVY